MADRVWPPGSCCATPWPLCGGGSAGRGACNKAADVLGHSSVGRSPIQPGAAVQGRGQARREPVSARACCHNSRWEQSRTVTQGSNGFSPSVGSTPVESKAEESLTGRRWTCLAESQQEGQCWESPSQPHRDGKQLGVRWWGVASQGAGTASKRTEFTNSRSRRAA